MSVHDILSARSLGIKGYVIINLNLHEIRVLLLHLTYKPNTL